MNDCKKDAPANDETVMRLKRYSSADWNGLLVAFFG